jgi:hypothetical protein
MSCDTVATDEDRPGSVRMWAEFTIGACYRLRRLTPGPTTDWLEGLRARYEAAPGDPDFRGEGHPDRYGNDGLDPVRVAAVADQVVAEFGLPDAPIELRDVLLGKCTYPFDRLTPASQ